MKINFLHSKRKVEINAQTSSQHWAKINVNTDLISWQNFKDRKYTHYHVQN